MTKYPKNSQVFFSVNNLDEITFDVVSFALQNGYKYFHFAEKETNMPEFKRALANYFTDNKTIDREDYFFQCVLSNEDIESNQTRNAITRITKELDEINYVDSMLIERPTLNFD